MGVLETIVRRHAELKERIHKFRLPIHSRAGRFAVGCVYFSVPVIIGYCTLQITNGPGGIAERNLGKHGELLKAKRAEQEERLRRVPVASRPPQPLNPPEKLA